MKSLLVIITVILGLNPAFGQCSFDPLVSPSSLNLCPNSSDTLWSTPANSYLWYKNNNPILDATNQFLVVNQAQDAGSNFLVVATIGGCSEPSPSVLVSNAALPPLVISIADSLSSNACQGDLRSLVLNEPYNNNILWFRDGVQLGGQSNDTLTVSQTGLYSSIAFAENCPSYSQTASALQITFSNATTPSIIFNSGTLTLSTPTPASSYAWYIDGNLIIDSNSQTFLPQQNGEVTVEAIYNEGCSRFSLPYSYSSFTANCDHDPIITPNDLILCPNASDTLFTQAGDAHQWFKDGTALLNENDSFLVISSLDAGSEFSVETTLDGCTEMTPEVLVDGWAFLPIFVITEGLGSGSLCEGDTLTLTVSSTFSENIRWSRDGNLIEGENESSLVIFENGIYSVTGATSTCPDYEETSLDLNYNFLSNPVPVLTYFPVSNTIGADVSAANYTWSVDEDIFPGLSSQVITPTIDGNYVVQVSYSNGCSNVSEPYFYSTVGVDETDTSYLKVFPNPGKGQFFYSGSSKGQLNILDISGRLIRTIQIQSESGIISTSDLSEGIYYFDFQTNNSRQLTPVVVLK
jgi:hypothetical protein